VLLQRLVGGNGHAAKRNAGADRGSMTTGSGRNAVNGVPPSGCEREFAIPLRR